MKYQNHFIQDLAIIALSILIAVILVKTGALINLLSASKNLERFGSFISGIFFTSIFTVAPAAVTLGELARINSVFWNAFWGGIGALLGDLIIFRFVKDRFSEDLKELLRHNKISKRLRALFRLKFFRWLTFLIGGLIIASPLPDELGIGLLGFSKMKISWFIPLSLIFNFIGIYLVGLAAKAVL
ncbi:MAG: hypothetical protein HYY86_03005 [Candidatus Harrisonbacteria bacterium]|nr:hypothetical protein [Candidatus Harrisonbacteria bacterium]